MRLLLDTHVVIWWWTDPTPISATARSAIADAAEEIVVSSASAWEIAIKVRSGKLAKMAPIVPRYSQTLIDSGFNALQMTDSHAIVAGGYTAAHRDPFDRMLAAQAELEDLVLVTRDPAFAAFPCRTLW